LSKTRQELGRWGESLAADYLTEHGFVITAHNVRTPYGEIDLIAQKSSKSSENEITTVFVEVKTRTTQSFGYPEEAITNRKRANLISAVEHYLQENPDLEGFWRIDVIAIEQYPNRSPIINHFENAIQ
jgi:putative endonuclease